MTAYRWSSVSALAALVAGPLTAQSSPTIEQFLSPASPLEVVAAKQADVIAWMSYERGMRNVYVARGPAWRPLRITRFLQDDGIDVGGVRLSDDGSLAIFVRGSAQNRQGWVANPGHDPDGADRAVWVVRTDGTGAWRLASLVNTQAATGGGFGGGSPVLSPDGRWVAFVKDGQIYRASTARGPKPAMDTGGVPFIKAWGRQSNPVWSPDGRKLAFVSNRDNHSFIAVYDMATRRLDYLAPGVDFDTSPTWSADSKQVAFIRKPGLSFGQQAAAQQGVQGGQGGQGGRGGQSSGCRPQPGGGFGGFGFQQDTMPPTPADGLCRAAFAGGYTVSFMVGDVATLTAKEFWHNEPLDHMITNVNSIAWAGDHVVFTAQVPRDEWDRWFSVRIDGSTTKPVLLTTTDGLINDGAATTTAVSRDGKTLYYATNATDIEKRHIWAVPVAGGTPQRINKHTTLVVSMSGPAGTPARPGGPLSAPAARRVTPVLRRARSGHVVRDGDGGQSSPYRHDGQRRAGPRRRGFRSRRPACRPKQWERLVRVGQSARHRAGPSTDVGRAGLLASDAAQLRNDQQPVGSARGRATLRDGHGSCRRQPHPQPPTGLVHADPVPATGSRQDGNAKRVDDRSVRQPVVHRSDGDASARAHRPERAPQPIPGSGHAGRCGDHGRRQAGADRRLRLR